MQKLDCKI